MGPYLLTTEYDAKMNKEQIIENKERAACWT